MLERGVLTARSLMKLLRRRSIIEATTTDHITIVTSKQRIYCSSNES
jgi:hypothetical protein